MFLFHARTFMGYFIHLFIYFADRAVRCLYTAQINVCVSRTCCMLATRWTVGLCQSIMISNTNVIFKLCKLWCLLKCENYPSLTPKVSVVELSPSLHFKSLKRLSAFCLMTIMITGKYIYIYIYIWVGWLDYTFLKKKALPTKSKREQ